MSAKLRKKEIAVLAAALLSGCSTVEQQEAVSVQTAASVPSPSASVPPVYTAAPSPSLSPVPSASAESEVSDVETSVLSSDNENGYESAADISEELAELEDSMNFSLKDGDVATKHYKMSEENAENLRETMEALTDAGYDFGFYLEDLNTRKAAAYNADEDFYCASSIKAFYIASVLDYNPSSYDTDKDSMINAVMYSDNDAYAYLREKYWRDPIRRWCAAAGVDNQIAEEMYPDYSAREVAKLWAVNYWWFDNDPQGKLAAEWYESPNMSEIRKLVDPDIVTRTKAGWIVYSDEDETLIATNEGGIIYDGDHPYILVVMSNVPSDFDRLGPLMQALMNVHDEMAAG